jgi:hypothetical protein
MRNLLILILLCVGIYCFYKVISKGTGSSSQANASPPQFVMPDPVAFRMTLIKPNAPEVVEVYLIHGDHWRRERRKIDFPGTFVTIFDGTRIFTDDPDVTTTTGFGSVLQTAISSLNGLKPVASGLQDGHQCWLFKTTLESVGTSCNLWIDQQTNFPVFASGASDGVYVEEHFQLLKSDFNVLEKTCFDTSNTAPMLVPFLTP